MSGVELTPRRDYLAALQRSQQSCAEALCGPQLDCTAVLLPPPRVFPIYQTREGRSFALAPGAAAPRAVPFLPGSPLEIAETGGFDGGFLALGDSPKLPAPRGPAAPFGWVSEYFGGAPGYTDYMQRQPRWAAASAAVKAAVANVTDPRVDEWRQSWFGGVRSAAAGRTPIYESGAAAPLGASFFGAGAARGLDEYHQAFFADNRDRAAATRAALAPLLGPVPATMFAPGEAGGSFASGALRDTSAFGELGGMLLDRAGGTLGGMLGDSLRNFVQDQLAALAGGGSTFENLRGALGVLGAGGCFGTDGGRDLTGLLGTDGCFGGGDLAGMLDGLSDKLAGQALGMLKDAVFNSLWTVDDRSSAAEAVAHKYAQELADKYGEAFLSDPQATIDSIKQKLTDLFVGASSSACVMIGLAYPNPSPLVVQINGLPATRLDDPCEMPKAPDVGPFIMGNPTVLINGMPASGDVHVAVGKFKGTVAVPMVISANVLMGMVTVTVDPPPQAGAPADSGAGGAGGAAAGAEGGASGGSAADEGAAGAEADGGAPTSGPPADSASEGSTTSDAPPGGGADAPSEEGEVPDIRGPHSAVKGVEEADDVAHEMSADRAEAERSQALDEADELRGQADQLRLDADGARAEADALRREAAGAAANGDVRDAMRLSADAGRADALALQRELSAAEAEARAAGALETARNLPDGHSIPHGLPGRAAQWLGPLGDLYTAGHGIHEMSNAAERGDQRGVITTGAGTIGDLAGGTGGAAGVAAAGAWAGLACGPLAWVCSPAGALVGGVLGGYYGSSYGEQAGAYVGNAAADYMGYPSSPAPHP